MLREFSVETITVRRLPVGPDRCEDQVQKSDLKNKHIQNIETFADLKE